MKKLLLTIVLLAASSAFFAASAQIPAWLGHIKPSGYLQGGYSYTVGGDNTFYIKRARLTWAGDLYKSPEIGTFDYKVQVDFANSPKLVDLFLKYTFCPEFGVQLGQFKTPLTIENSENPPAKLEFIDYSLVVQRFAQMSAQDLGGVNSTGRDMGIQFFGALMPMSDGHPLLRYNLALFNGNGINKMDDDNLKNFMARMMVYPMKELNIGAYYMRRVGHMDEVNIYRDYDYRVRDRYGVGIAYDGKYAFARTEIIEGHTDGYLARAAYVSGGFKVTDKLVLAARYDYFNENVNTERMDMQYITGEISYHLFPNLRFQLDYVYKQQMDRTVNHMVNFMTTIIY